MKKEKPANIRYYNEFNNTPPQPAPKKGQARNQSNPAEANFDVLKNFQHPTPQEKYGMPAMAPNAEVAAKELEKRRNKSK